MTTKKQFIENAQKKLLLMPPITKQFYNYRIASGAQPSTMYTTLNNLHQFFTWFCNHTPDLNVPEQSALRVSDLALINPETIQAYITSMLAPADGTKPVSKNTINTRLMSLRGFFRWLTVESTDPQNAPHSYLDNNPMLKIKFKYGQTTLNAKANAINKKIYDGDRKFNFLEWLQNDYKKTLSPQALKLYEQTEIRNCAIFSLLIASGLRVTELVNIELADIDNDKHIIENVIRKGDHEDVVKYAAWAEPYIADWLEYRDLNFGEQANSALFVTLSRGLVYRISQSQVERMVKKYTKAFGRETTPHKLRHTFGTELYRATNSVIDVQQALGQTTDSATKIYIHADQDKRNQAIEKLE